MEKTERETQDFMNVDSFSQLPFIRPSNPQKEKGIRLFGIEFGGDITITDDSENAEANTTEDTKDNDTNSSESGRRFECHYCFRNFPTSQALGGHQNAHKRERQHAKRAHLQSTMALHSIPNSHMYGLINYRPPALPYPSWNTGNIIVGSSNHTSRFYRSHSSVDPLPINGSPVPMWRIPAAQTTPNYSRDRLLLPLFAGEENSNSMINNRPGSQQDLQLQVYEPKKPNVHDHVSLDLHL